MTILARGETVDACNNPKLDLFTSIGGILTDVAELEWQIFDITDELSPIQVEPVSGRNTANVTDLCPTGDKIATGHYAVTWTVPAAQVLGKHEIRWFFKLTPTSPEETHEEEFEVLTISGAGDSDSLDVAAFKAKFTKFDSLSSTEIQEGLDFAREEVDPLCVEEQYTKAVCLVAAHYVEMTAGDRAKGVASVTAGSASISYFGPVSGGTSESWYAETPYGRVYLEILRRCGPGMRVLC